MLEEIMEAASGKFLQRNNVNNHILYQVMRGSRQGNAHKATQESMSLCLTSKNLVTP